MNREPYFHDDPPKGDTFKAGLIIGGLVAVLVLLWVANPSCGPINIAPDNNSININGAQRAELEAQ